jgi:hypothetical protein
MGMVRRLRARDGQTKMSHVGAVAGNARQRPDRFLPAPRASTAFCARDNMMRNRKITRNLPETCRKAPFNGTAEIYGSYEGRQTAQILLANCHS